MMKICNIPNYSMAQKLAYDTISDSEINALPISIKKLIKTYPNLYLQKYSVFARENNLNMEETIEILDSEDGCLWRRDTNDYIILYNDLINNKGRIRFTLAHELGHYILKHNEKTNKTILNRYSLTVEEYDNFEKEANYFAKRLLAPIPLVDRYLNEWNKIYENDVEDIFSTSYTVALYVINGLNKRYQYANIIKESHVLEENFENFLYKDLQTVICNKCSASIDKKYSYCGICGSPTMKETKKLDFYLNRERRLNSMNYKKIALNKEGIASQCPICKNDDLNPDKEICDICGTYIKNKCSGIYPDDVQNYNGPPPPNFLEGCNNILKGNSRFCSDCGCMSTFYIYEVLKPWKNELDDAGSNLISMTGDPLAMDFVNNNNINDVPF